jgi:glycerol uptake facilitator protein
MSAHRTLLPAWAVGEFLGTFLLVFFGCGSVASAVLLNAHTGVFPVAVIWGLGIATAIYLTNDLSGAHLNPSVTLALASWNGFPWRRVPGYWLAQFLGAFAASAVLYLAFAGALTAFETSHAVVRGAPGSEASAMIFGEYFPNPGGHALTDAARAIVSPATAFFVECFGTLILVLVILSVTNPRNGSRPGLLTAVTIGLTITLLISLFAPLTMAGFNPARDFAPRLFSSLAGWHAIPFTTNGTGWLTIYILAPFTGALAGGAAYRFLLHPHYNQDN